MDTLIANASSSDDDTPDMSITNMWCAIVESFDGVTGEGFARQGGHLVRLHREQQGTIENARFAFFTDGEAQPIPQSNDIVLAYVVGDVDPGTWVADTWVLVQSTRPTRVLREEAPAGVVADAPSSAAFVDEQSSEQVAAEEMPSERATVHKFFRAKGYGFAQLDGDGSMVFLHCSDQGRRVDGNFVRYKRHDERALPSEGSAILLTLKTEMSHGRFAAGAWTFEPVVASVDAAVADLPALEASAAPIDVLPPAPEQNLIPPVSVVEPPAPPDKPKPDPANWIEVEVTRVRVGHTAYAGSEVYGEILVPPEVLASAKITGIRKGQTRFEIRCCEKEDGEQTRIVATQIRRF